MSANPPTLASLLESFFRNRLAAQLCASPATICAYRDALRLFLVFASERAGKPPSRLSIEEISRDIVLAFLDHLEAARGNGIRTRNARLAAIRSFFQHVAYSDPASISIAQCILSIPSKRTSKRVVAYLPQDQLDAILAAPDRTKIQGRRDHALLLFLVRTGARVSEAIAVNGGDLRFERPIQVLLHGKGRKDRVLPLATDVVAVMRALIAERPHMNSGDAVFINARGKRLTRFGVNHIVDRAAGVASKTVSELTRRSTSPHQLIYYFRKSSRGATISEVVDQMQALRAPPALGHTTAMHLLQAGVDLTTIASWLGHANVDTTHHYVEADLEMKRRALAKCDQPEAPPSRFEPTDELLALLERL